MSTHTTIQPLSVLEIHLGEIARNWLLLKKKLKSGTECAVVVKADAYGMGAAQVAPALYERGCRHFFTATFEEAIALRAALPMAEAVIYVLHGLCGAQPADFTAHNLIPVLNTPQELALWAAASWETGKKQPSILHLDTGMNRLGFGEKECAALDKEQLKQLDIRYVMSHLACASDPANPRNREQLDLFRQRTAHINAPRSLSSSGGIFLGEDYHFDLARPGCGLYGINPQPGTASPLHGVLALKARILQVRDVGAGETVGYGATYSAKAPVKCATVSVGYADGYLRSLSENGTIIIGGEKCPVLGRVSMDLIVADTTALPRQPLPGDWAEIIGPHQPVDKVAQQAGTIGYEILTALGKRYKRVYMGL